jgi:hypothetical protein
MTLHDDDSKLHVPVEPKASKSRIPVFVGYYLNYDYTYAHMHIHAYLVCTDRKI